MAMKDLHSNILQKVALNIQAISSDTTTVGNIIDTRGFQSCEFVNISGTITDGDYALLIEHGDEANLSDAAPVADADLIGTEAAASFDADDDDNKALRVGYIGEKRYVRASLVSTNTTSGGTLGVLAILGHPHVAATDAS